MKKAITLALLIISLLLTSCEVYPSKVSEKKSKRFIKSITYVYDSRTDICYAIVAARRATDTDQNGIGLTVVPYEKVKGVVPVIIIK